MLNVILNVFSCSAQAPCNVWATKYFSGNVVSLVVPSPFQQNAIRWAKTGDLFKAALTELRPDLKHETINQRMLVTFSVGWTFAHELFKFEKELNQLDAYLLLDGCHTPDLSKWSDFASRAMKGNAVMIAAHSSITPPFISSTKSNTTIMNLALDKCTPAENVTTPDYVSSKPLPKPITIYLGAAGTKGTSQYLPAISKTWKEDPLLDCITYGKFIKLHYSGNDRPDHVYIAWHTAERMWKWMGELMMEDTAPEIPKLKKPPADLQPTTQEPAETTYVELPIVTKPTAQETAIIPSPQVVVEETKEIVKRDQNPLIAFFIWLFTLITSLFKR